MRGTRPVPVFLVCLPIPLWPPRPDLALLVRSGLRSLWVMDGSLRGRFLWYPRVESSRLAYCVGWLGELYLEPPTYMAYASNAKGVLTLETGWE